MISLVLSTTLAVGIRNTVRKKKKGIAWLGRKKNNCKQEITIKK